MRRARLFVFLFLPIASACGSHSAHALRTPQMVDSAGVELISPDKLAIDGDRTKLVIGIPIHMRLSFDGTSLKDSTGVDSVLFEAIVRLRSGRVVRLHAQQDWGDLTQELGSCSSPIFSLSAPLKKSRASACAAHDRLYWIDSSGGATALICERG